MSDLPDLPPGAVLLSADDAVHAVTTGDHPQVETGDLSQDAYLVDGLRSGAIVAARFADGRLAFTRVVA